MSQITGRFDTKPSGRLALAVAATLLSACGEMPEQVTPPVTEQVSAAAASNGGVLGRVVYIEKGKEQEWPGYSFPFDTDVLTLLVQSTATGQMQHANVERDGSFLFPLQAGEYVFVGYQVSRGRGSANFRRTGRIWATFTVPHSGQAVYIGDLRIDADTSGYRLVDRYSEALERAEAQLKEQRLEAIKGLMRFEQQAGHYKRVIALCTAGWGIECDKNRRGVEPMTPEGTAGGFPTTEDLTPSLEWKPSSRSDITYDIVIFESLRISEPWVNVERMRGPLVAYAEGLREPRFKPSVPLQSGKRYQWTVRLRSGDTVSSWSTTGFDYFIARRSGQDFGFETPSR
jgi:hypothetical protein